MSVELAKRGVPHRYAEFSGGHEWLPPALAGDALEFFTGHVPPAHAEDSKDERRQFEKFARLSQELAGLDGGAKRSLVERLRKDSAKADDLPDRRVARRVLAGAFIGAVEQAREQSRQKDYAGAARSWQTAVLVQPDNAGAWYALAVAEAGAGNKRRALEALEEAASRGLHDWSRVENEPLFAPLRGDPRYKTIVSR